MCFGGGGKSAEQIYQERKPEFGALPSLSMDRSEVKAPKLEDVVRKGARRRSLLSMGGYNA